jgi:hypothetical protein
MSERDLLAVAARALRERTTPDLCRSDDAARTRARVLLAAGATRRRRVRITALLVPIAAVLVLSTAWAGVRGDLPRTWRELRSVIVGEDTRATNVGRAPSRVPAPRAASEPVTAGAPHVDPPREAEAVPTFDVLDLPVAAAPSPVTARAPAVARAPIPGDADAAPPPEDAPPEVEDELYAAAHRAHFVDHDPEAALRAWDAYLRAAPAGRLAIEARYDRALALVRLHRDDDARAALAPFAAGAPGAYAYRRAEARRLLDAMGEPRR